MTKRPKMAEILGRNIRAMREKRGITQYDLADRVDTVQTTISSYELGRVANLDPNLVAKIATALDVKLGQLYDPNPPIDLVEGEVPELVDAYINYQYVFKMTGRKIRAIASKEITLGKPVGRYTTKYFDADSGVEIDDPELIRILRSRIGEIIPLLREQKAAYGR